MTKIKDGDVKSENTDITMDGLVAWGEKGTWRPVDEPFEPDGLDEEIENSMLSWPMKLTSILINLNKNENQYVAELREFKKRNKRRKKTLRFPHDPGLKDSTLNSKIKDEVSTSSRTSQIQPLLTWMLQKELIKKWISTKKKKEMLYRIDQKGIRLARILQSTEISTLSPSINDCEESVFILFDLLKGFP